MKPPWKMVLLSIMVTFLFACDPDKTPAVTYRPLFIPIECAISLKELSCKASASVMTPVGKFGIEQDVFGNPPAAETNQSHAGSTHDGSTLVIRHRSDGSIKDALYLLDTDQEITVTGNGKFRLKIQQRRTFVDVSDSSVTQLRIKDSKAGPDPRPVLAKSCPPSNGAPTGQPAAAARLSGSRTVDQAAGISYKAYGAPWKPVAAAFASRGELKIAYDVGQEFVTEPDYVPGSSYYASILSGNVPAAVEDGTAIDLVCVGKQVTEDVLVSFYPKLSRRETLKEASTTLGGLRARVVKLRLSFSEPNLRAKSELVSIAVLDLGRAEVAILYVSIPDTHKQYEYITDEALTSIRPV